MKIKANKKPQMKFSLSYLALSLCLSASGTVAAGGFVSDTEKPDTSEWACEYCKLLDGYDAKVTFNFANLSDDAYRFGNYTGAEDGGAVFVDSQIKYLDTQAHYFNLDLKNAGIDSIALNTAYGVYGGYRLNFDFQQIPLRKYAALDTPFNNVGSSNLSLPNGWQLYDGSTVPSVGANWSQFDLGRDWRRFKLGWRQDASDRVDYQINFQRIENKGLRDFSAAQIWNATYLPLPIDHQSDQLDARLSYQGENFWASINYQLFAFNNNNDSLRYANPFQSFVVGSEFGQMAAEPDNKAYKLGFNFNTNFSNSTWLKLRGAIGQMTQNESFLPFSTNNGFAVTLPTDSLDGKIDTSDFSARLFSRLSSKFSIHANYGYHDQDNKTEQLVYQPVVADSFIGSEVTNLPYDYQTSKYAVGGEWKFWPGQMISAEFKGDSKERSLTSIRKTDNKGVEGKLRLNHDSGVQLNVKLSRFERDASQLEMIDVLTVEENPLMQRFNQAGRDEDKARFQFIVSHWSDFNFSVSGEYLDQQYINNTIGLQQNQRRNLGFDFNWHINPQAEFSLYYLGERVDVDMASSQNFSIPDWYANSEDLVDNVGLSLQWKNLLDKQFDIGFDASRSEGETRIDIISGSSSELPKMNSDWTTLKLKMEYRYSKQWTFQLRYQMDKFDSEDYALDGVVPGTVGNLLTFGASSFNYDVNYLVAGVSYHFF